MIQMKTDDHDYWGRIPQKIREKIMSFFVNTEGYRAEEARVIFAVDRG